MWSKVNKWLVDFDQKQDNIEDQSTDEKPQIKINMSFMSKDMFDEGFEFTKDDISKIQNDTIDFN